MSGGIRLQQNQNPAQWTYSIDGNGNARAFYPGIVDWTESAEVQGYTNVAAMQAATISSLITMTQTKGYYTEGDGGGAVYVRGGGAGPGAVQSADGSWWQLVPTGDAANPLQFGCRGNGATDDNARFLSALQSGRIVDGLGRTYAISGSMTPTSFVGLRNANFIQTNPTLAGVATLNIFALSDWFIDNCKFNMGSVQNTGNNDSGNSAIRVRNNDGSYCLNFSITNVTVFGDGSGSRMQVRQSKRFKILGCTVRDAVASFAPDPTNDIMNAYDIGDCSNFTVANCEAFNLLCVLSGVPSNRNARGFLFSEIRDCAIIGCNATTIDQTFDFSGAVVPGVTPAYYEGNRRFALVGCTANFAGTWGFKFANVTHDAMISGCVASYCGSAGFVCSAPVNATTPEAYATQNLDFVGCKVVNVLGTGAAGAGNAQGFRAMRSAVGIGNFDTYPRGIRFKNCEVIDNQPVPTTQVGFASDVNLIYVNTVPNTGYNKNICNSATGCSVGDNIPAPFSLIGPIVSQVNGTGSQSIVNATWVPVLWDNNSIDFQGMHSPISNTDKIYIREPGTYEISAILSFAANAVGGRLARITKNSVPLDRSIAVVTVCGAGQNQTVLPTAIDIAKAGDIYAVEGYQNSGGNLNVVRTESIFTVRRID